VVENLRPGSTMLCVVSGRNQYTRKFFNGKHLWSKIHKSLPPSNDLMYKVLPYMVFTILLYGGGLRLNPYHTILIKIT